MKHCSVLHRQSNEVIPLPYEFPSMQSLKVDFPYISKFQFEDVARTTGGRMSDVVLTKARREYNDYYTGEVELNEYFNNFVHNYTLAYQGPNTAKAQIGVKVKKSQASGTIEAHHS